MARTNKSLFLTCAILVFFLFLPTVVKTEGRPYDPCVFDRSTTPPQVLCGATSTCSAPSIAEIKCEETTFTKISKDCAKQIDCSGYSGVTGGQCLEGSCYLDEIGFQKFQTQQTLPIPLVEVKSDLEIFAPKTNIKLPSMSDGFSDVSKNIVEDSDGTYLLIPWIGEYLGAIFNFALGVVSIVAVTMIIIQGAKVVVSAGGSAKGEAYKRITQAVIGLIIMWGSYVILYTVNPNLVKFKSLKIQYIQPIPLSVEEKAGVKFGFEYDGDATIGAIDSPVTDGGYYKTLMETCGAKDGWNLPTYTERQDRLLQIVKVLKQLGVDQRGATYVRGGKLNCSSGNVDWGWGVDVFNSIFEDRPEFKSNLSSVCKDAILDKNYSYPGAEACRSDMNKIYKEYYFKKAGAAGMLCGDCGSTMRQVLFTCFGEKTDYRSADRNFRGMGTTIRKGSCVPDAKDADMSNYVFRFSRPAPPEELSAAVTKLQFGDILLEKRMDGKFGHVMLYTGGKGLGYEVLEMGGGGSRDVAGPKKEIAERLGLGQSWNPSTMQVHSSALEFLMKKTKSCLSAFRPLDKAAYLE